MNRAFQIGIMLAVAVHMGFGCCLHHAHASVPRIDLPLSADATCPCEHYGQQHSGQPRDHGNKQQGCEEGSCTFIRPEPSQGGDWLAGVRCPPLIWCLPPLPTLSGIASTDLVPSRFRAPTPLHLLNQALLL